MGDWRLTHSIRMADEIAATQRHALQEDVKALAKDLDDDVRSQYVFHRLGTMLERAVMLNSWRAIGDSLKRNAEPEALTQGSGSNRVINQ